MKCRICDADDFGEVIDLGSMPLANNLLDAPDDACPRWPLRVVICRACSLIQLTECPPPASMFGEYCYFSSQSQTMVEHGRALVERHVSPDQRVVEIASNDGYLLRHAQRLTRHVLGVDPAANVTAIANERGVPTRCEYFDAETAETIRREWGAADVIFANNVLAHVPDPNEIVAGIDVLLSDCGVAHIEVPYVARMLDAGAFDTIYHEHQCYFSVTALRTLMNRHDLKITGLEETPIHGGSLHLTVSRAGGEDGAIEYCTCERELGMFDDTRFRSFEQHVERIRDDLVRLVDQHGTVGAFGAAAKAVIVLNHAQLDAARIPWIADVSPHKQNRFIPGTGQAIVAPDRLIETKPDACVVFAWNLAEEIARRNADYLETGGRFFVPIPELREL